jgi:hypothetical protein
MSINGGRSLELHYHHCELRNTFLSLLGSGPLGHWGEAQKSFGIRGPSAL